MSSNPSAPPLSPTSPKDPLSGHLQELGEELECSICLEIYEDPVLLTCGHSFCRGCIRHEVRPLQRACVETKQQYRVKCPQCRKETPLVGSADTCMQKLNRNFQLAGIIEKFRAAQREKQRAEMQIEQQQALEQIEWSRRANEEERQAEQAQTAASSRGSQTTLASENSSPVEPAVTRRCKKCPFLAVICCVECGDDFCLECQQTHSHGESIAVREERHSEEVLKTGSLPPSCGPQHQSQQTEANRQQQLQQLQRKQQHLQLDLAQQQALAGFTPAPEWQQQQSHRWEELQEKRGTRRQISEEYPPRRLGDDMPQPQEPHSWPSSCQTQQVYHRQDLPHTGAVRYPHPGQHHSEEVLKTGPLPPSCGPQHQSQQTEANRQQQLQQLQRKQQHLQLDLAQQQALAGFTPAPEWQQQQSHRWEELQEKRGTRRQISEEYPPRRLGDDMPQPQEPHSWPSSCQTQQVYHRQDLPHTGAVRYPHPGQQGQVPPPPPPMTPTSQLTCSHCPFPAAHHCKQCDVYFCWECKGDLHDSKAACAQDNIVELRHMANLSGPYTFGPEQDVQKYSFPPTIPVIPMALATAIKVPTTSMEETVIYKTPYTCDIIGMGPGKNITVTGQPYDSCSRFHINLMCDAHLKKGDIALHFNPRFVFPKTVVRNSRIGGKYGKEEKKGPSFPFKAGQPFKIGIECVWDKFKVVVDGKLFTTYLHRIKDLQSIKFLNVNGDVQVTSVSGCT